VHVSREKSLQLRRESVGYDDIPSARATPMSTKPAADPSDTGRGTHHRRLKAHTEGQPSLPALTLERPLIGPSCLGTRHHATPTIAAPGHNTRATIDRLPARTPRVSVHRRATVKRQRQQTTHNVLTRGESPDSEHRLSTRRNLIRQSDWTDSTAPSPTCGRSDRAGMLITARYAQCRLGVQ
jgi:hypothetical protein